jgi:hypothetical protein
MRYLIFVFLIACGSSDSPTPDAARFDPAGQWSVVDTYQPNSCGVSNTTSDSFSIVDDAAGYFIGGLSGSEQLQPGPTVSCGFHNCVTSFSVAWNADSVFHYRQYSLALDAQASGGGSETINAGSGGCTANFVTGGSRP